MLKIRKFIIEERSYIILLFLTFVIFFMFFRDDRGGKSEKEGEQGLTFVQEAERKIQERAQDTEYWNSTLNQKPWLGPLIAGGSVLLLSVISIGLFLDVIWLVLLFRKRNLIPPFLKVPEPPFSLTDVFRISVILVSISLSSSIAISLIALSFGAETTPNFMMLLHTVITDLAVVFSVFYFAKSVYGCDLKTIGFNFERWGRNIALGLAAYCAVLPIFLAVLVSLIALANLIGYEPPPHPLVEVLMEEEKHPAVIAFSMILACAVGPIVEEIFFRGFFYTILRKRWGIVIAALISSAVFSGVHYSGFAFVPVFVLGLALVYLYESRGTLVPCFALHIIHNSVFLAYFFVLKALFLAE